MIMWWKIKMIYLNKFDIDVVRSTALRVLAGAAGGGAGSLGYIAGLIVDGRSGEGVVALLYSVMGGAIGGMVGVTIMSSTLLGIAMAPYFRGPYFVSSGQGVEVESHFTLFLLVITLIVAMRFLVAAVRKITGVNSLSEGLIPTIAITVFGMALFVVLHYMFLPAVWDKFIFNITS